MSEEPQRYAPAFEVTDVNHYDSQVWVSFLDGTTVTLTGEQIKQAAQKYSAERGHVNGPEAGEQPE